MCMQRLIAVACIVQAYAHDLIMLACIIGGA